jgi:hypothetical protein
MKKLFSAFVLVGALSVTSHADAAMRFGLGLGSSIGTGQQASVSSIVARAEVSPKLVGNFGLGFRSESGDFSDDTSLGFNIGGQFRVFTNEANNLHFHLLGGLSYARVGTSVNTTVTVTNTTTGVTTTKTVKTDVSNSEIGLYGGVGAEYFFPGTDQFSMEVDVGPRIDLLSSSPATGSDSSGTVLSLANNLSGGILFTYYFNMPVKK